MCWHTTAVFYQKVVDTRPRPWYNLLVPNPECPDHTSHEANVAEAMGYQPGEPLRHEDFDEWQARVDAEYFACEGH